MNPAESLFFPQQVKEGRLPVKKKGVFANDHKISNIHNIRIACNNSSSSHSSFSEFVLMLNGADI